MIIKIDTHDINDFTSLLIAKLADHCSTHYEARLVTPDKLGGSNTTVVGIWSKGGIREYVDHGVNIDIVDSKAKIDVDKVIIDQLIDKINDGLIIDKDWQREEILCWIRVQRIKAWASR